MYKFRKENYKVKIEFIFIFNVNTNIFTDNVQLFFYSLKFFFLLHGSPTRLLEFSSQHKLQSVCSYSCWHTLAICVVIGVATVPFDPTPSVSTLDKTRQINAVILSFRLDTLYRGFITENRNRSWVNAHK